MEKVKKWFEDFCEESDTGKEILKQIISGLTHDGFDENQLSNWIDSELKSVEEVVSSKFKKEVNVKD